MAVNYDDITNQANQQARGELNKYYEEGKSYQQPYYQAGLQGLQSLQDLMRNPQSIENTPGYQFRFGEGMKAVESSSAARGLGLSGATLKALARYGSNLASQEYGAEYTRRTGMAGFGQTAGTNMSGMASQMGTNMADLAINTANMRMAQQAANQQSADRRTGGLLGLLGTVGGAILGGVVGRGGGIGNAASKFPNDNPYV